MTENTAALTAEAFDKIAKRVTDREVAAARLAPDYAALVAHYGLTAESDADSITDAARYVVLAGAWQAGTTVGTNLTADDLTGRDPGAESKTRDYWKAARAVRAGLVRAIVKPSTDDAEDDVTDYLAKIVAAVRNGMSHDLDADQIQAAVESALYATRPDADSEEPDEVLPWTGN